MNLRFFRRLPIMLLFCSATAFGNGPDEKQILQAYFDCKEVSQTIAKLRQQNYEIKSTTASVINGDWNDEGFDGTFIVSTFMERGSEPWEMQSATIIAIVERNAGWIKRVRLLDPQKTESTLWSNKF